MSDPGQWQKSERSSRTQHHEMRKASERESNKRASCCDEPDERRCTQITDLSKETLESACSNALRPRNNRESARAVPRHAKPRARAIGTSPMGARPCMSAPGASRHTIPRRGVTPRRTPQLLRTAPSGRRSRRSTWRQSRPPRPVKPERKLRNPRQHVERDRHRPPPQHSQAWQYIGRQRWSSCSGELTRLRSSRASMGSDGLPTNPSSLRRKTMSYNAMSPHKPLGLAMHR